MYDLQGIDKTMFEGWASDILASYLGQVLDIQAEKLKVNLWKGTVVCAGRLLHGCCFNMVCMDPGKLDWFGICFQKRICCCDL